MARAENIAEFRRSLVGTRCQVSKLGLTSRHWPVARPELMHAISFVPLSLLTVCSFGLSALLTWSALALPLWNVFGARRDVYAVFNSA